jgi:hypothetical protein
VSAVIWTKACRQARRVQLYHHVLLVAKYLLKFKIEESEELTDDSRWNAMAPVIRKTPPSFSIGGVR